MTYSVLTHHTVAYLAPGKLALILYSSISLSKVIRSTQCLAAYWMYDVCLHGLA